MDMKVLSLSFFIALLLPFFVSAQNIQAGFLSDNIWYSKDPFFFGEQIRIYSGVFNSADGDLKGTVEFSDNGNPIGSSDFFVEKGGNLNRVWVDWQAGAGEHTIEAKIVSAKLILAGGEEVAVELAKSQTASSKRFVDQDIDGDNIGNADDKDDNNDGATDEHEKNFGTDQNMFNTPQELARAEGRVPESAGEYRENEFAPEEENILDKLPTPVARVTKSVDNKLKDSLQKPLDAIEKARVELKQKMEQDEGADNFINKGYATILDSLHWALETRFLLYVAVLFIVYKIVKRHAYRRREA